MCMKRWRGHVHHVCIVDMRSNITWTCKHTGRKQGEEHRDTEEDPEAGGGNELVAVGRQGE